MDENHSRLKGLERSLNHAGGRAENSLGRLAHPARFEMNALDGESAYCGLRKLRAMNQFCTHHYHPGFDPAVCAVRSNVIMMQVDAFLFNDSAFGNERSHVGTNPLALSDSHYFDRYRENLMKSEVKDAASGAENAYRRTIKVRAEDMARTVETHNPSCVSIGPQGIRMRPTR